MTTSEQFAGWVFILTFVWAAQALAWGLDALRPGAGWLAWGVWWSLIAYRSGLEFFLPEKYAGVRP